MKKMREKKEQMRKNNKGFSLVELIIVIAIMAILVGIIGSQVVPYMEKARVSKDRTTLDTVYTSFQSALAENGVTADITADGIDTATDGLTAKSATVSATTLELLGTSLDTNAELNAKFHSQDAGTDNVQFSFVAATGKISVTKGTLTVTN